MLEAPLDRLWKASGATEEQNPHPLPRTVLLGGSAGAQFCPLGTEVFVAGQRLLFHPCSGSWGNGQCSPVLEVQVPILPRPWGGPVSVSQVLQVLQARQKAEGLISTGLKDAGIRISLGVKFMIFKTMKNQTPPVLQLPETASLLQQSFCFFKVAVHLV